MRVLQTISSLDPRLGGVASCTGELLLGLNERINCELLTLDSESKPPSTDFVHYLPNDSFSGFTYSGNWRRFCNSLASDSYDVFHINGLWQYPAVKTCLTAEKLGKPYVISLHGMLYPEALAHSHWEKVIMRKLCFDRLLSNAACIHATCETEMLHYRRLGFGNPVAVIPNTVSIPPEVARISGERSVKRIGYLGRLHPRKNVEWLLEAWQKLNPSDAELWIMGSGEAEYETHLRELASEKNLKNVIFKGFVAGLDKYQALASCYALAVPSTFENFGMIVPEALAVGTPVIATTGMPWEELQRRDCGWWIAPDPESLAAAVDAALKQSPADIRRRGENGKMLVSGKYARDRVAGDMVSLYEWIVHGGSKPDCVITD